MSAELIKIHPACQPRNTIPGYGKLNLIISRRLLLINQHRNFVAENIKYF